MKRKSISALIEEFRPRVLKWIDRVYGEEDVVMELEGFWARYVAYFSDFPFVYLYHYDVETRELTIWGGEMK